ncbi:hypothetical protein PR002_g13546 [Phytophthora rubi]|uniref:Uncharacterized protein n=1 Tax=Phytophthora rubi TaxID=129364 RepID=A0A6A3LG21_9STRA|nr:hypothetical protein PR002_g13546 [Phytophthora rubi]
MRAYLGRHGVCFVVRAGRQSDRIRVVSTLDTNVPHEHGVAVAADHGGAGVGAGGVDLTWFVAVIVVATTLEPVASEPTWFLADDAGVGVGGVGAELVRGGAVGADLGGAGVGTVVVAELEWFEPVLERLIMVASVIALLASELEWLVVVVVAVAAVPVMSLVAERHLYTKNK